LGDFYSCCCVVDCYYINNGEFSIDKSGFCQSSEIVKNRINELRVVGYELIAHNSSQKLFL